MTDLKTWRTLKRVPSKEENFQITKISRFDVLSIKTVINIAVLLVREISIIKSDDTMLLYTRILSIYEKRNVLLFTASKSTAQWKQYILRTAFTSRASCMKNFSAIQKLTKNPCFVKKSCERYLQRKVLKLIAKVGRVGLGSGLKTWKNHIELEIKTSKE